MSTITESFVQAELAFASYFRLKGSEPFKENQLPDILLQG
jgi:hypothetical protein